MVVLSERYGSQGPSSYLSNINIEQLLLRLVMASQQQEVGWLIQFRERGESEREEEERGREWGKRTGKTGL